MTQLQAQLEFFGGTFRPIVGQQGRDNDQLVFVK